MWFFCVCVCLCAPRDRQHLSSSFSSSSSGNGEEIMCFLRYCSLGGVVPPAATRVLILVAVALTSPLFLLSFSFHCKILVLKWCEDQSAANSGPCAKGLLAVRCSDLLSWMYVGNWPRKDKKSVDCFWVGYLFIYFPWSWLYLKVPRRSQFDFCYTLSLLVLQHTEMLIANALQEPGAGRGNGNHVNCVNVENMSCLQSFLLLFMKRSWPKGLVFNLIWNLNTLLFLYLFFIETKLRQEQNLPN